MNVVNALNYLLSSVKMISFAYINWSLTGFHLDFESLPGVTREVPMWP